MALASSSAACLPPATLSLETSEAISASLTARSTAMTGMLFSSSGLTAAAAESESTGLMMTPCTPLVAAVASWLVWVAESFCASTTSSVMPAASAASVAPSRRSTKNGLLRVETARVTWPPDAPSSPRLQPVAPSATVRPKASTAVLRLKDVNFIVLDPSLVICSGCSDVSGWCFYGAGRQCPRPAR